MRNTHHHYSTLAGKTSYQPWTLPPGPHKLLLVPWVGRVLAWSMLILRVLRLPAWKVGLPTESRFRSTAGAETRERLGLGPPPLTLLLRAFSSLQKRGPRGKGRQVMDGAARAWAAYICSHTSCTQEGRGGLPPSQATRGVGQMTITPTLRSSRAAGRPPCSPACPWAAPGCRCPSLQRRRRQRQGGRGARCSSALSVGPGVGDAEDDEACRCHPPPLPLPGSKAPPRQRTPA